MYYYRKRREGGRVVSEYVGAGPLVELLAEEYAQDRAYREAEREAERLAREEYEAQDKHVADLVKLARVLTRAVLLDAGYHTHKGQWRKARR